MGKREERRRDSRVPAVPFQLRLVSSGAGRRGEERGRDSREPAVPSQLRLVYSSSACGQWLIAELAGKA